MIDGEVVALDAEGRPSFQILQNYGNSPGPVVFFVFDVLVLGGVNVMNEPLTARRALLEKKVLPKLKEPIRYSLEFDTPLPDLIAAVKAQGLEGLVAKRRDSRYEPGLRSGAWQKMRINAGQEFVIGGYTVGTLDVRRAGVRVLRGRRADVRREDAQRVLACVTGGAVQEDSSRWRSRSARLRTCRKRRAVAGALG